MLVVVHIAITLQLISGRWQASVIRGRGSLPRGPEGPEGRPKVRARGPVGPEGRVRGK